MNATKDNFLVGSYDVLDGDFMQVTVNKSWHFLSAIFWEESAEGHYKRVVSELSNDDPVERSMKFFFHKRWFHNGAVQLWKGSANKGEIIAPIGPSQWVSPAPGSFLQT